MKEINLLKVFLDVVSPEIKRRSIDDYKIKDYPAEREYIYCAVGRDMFSDLQRWVNSNKAELENVEFRKQGEVKVKYKWRRPIIFINDTALPNYLIEVKS